MNTKSNNSGETWFGHLRAAFVSTIALSILLGGAYPLAVWAIGRLPGLREKADGSLIVDAKGAVRGSRLIGQTFAGPEYFHPRPSAAGDGYDGSLSSGTNWGPTNAKLITGVSDLAAAYREENGLNPDAEVPADAVTRSGSGLDPHISVRNAEFQTARIARERRISEDRIRKLIGEHTAGRSIGVFGEPGVNVVTLNAALDGYAE